ncbi:MAG: type III pantothenate kinase [candidate division WOR-3 bacterium]
MDVIFCVDIGNKNIKTGVFDKDGLKEVILGLPDPLLFAKCELIIISSVSRTKLDAYLRLIEKSPFTGKIIKLRPQDQKYLKINYTDPSQLGEDRLAFAFFLKENYGEALGVDAGSFINIEYVKDDIHFPMAIFPGLSLLKECYGRGERLKKLDIDNIVRDTPYIFPRSSIECIGKGVRLAVKGLVGGLMDLTGCNRIVFTGGDGKILRDILGFGEYVENAVLLGLFAYYRLLTSRSNS